MLNLKDIKIENLDNLKCKNICYYTSFLFLINTVIAFNYNYLVYGLVFLFLFITSTLYHYEKNCKYQVIDKIAVYTVVIYGGYIFIKKIIEKKNKESINFKNIIYMFIIIITFLSTIYLYYVGYIYNKYCYDPDKFKSECTHGILHFISMIGHLFIIIF
tara:strand:+ start:1565 stop:2041 length:477 start_codon:yes stop_codon:yes gene_type:complete